MTATWRWTVWLILLALTLGAMGLVGREPAEYDLVADAAEDIPDSGSQAAASSAGRSMAPPAALAAPQPSSAKAKAGSVGADPFAVRSWYVAPPPPKPEPPPKPSAPPLPFRYLGMLESGEGSWLVQLARGDEGIVAAQGDVIGDMYRLDGLRDGDLVFTYLPLGTRQLLPAILDSGP